jgi:hypothetical protein
MKEDNLILVSDYGDYVPPPSAAVTPLPREKPSAGASSSSGSSGTGRGWLCDYDGRGEVALWSKPALAFQEGNEIESVVGMTTRGCVDVTLLNRMPYKGILFYKVRVAGKMGWVDVDYYYPVAIGKPKWSTN